MLKLNSGKNQIHQVIFEEYLHPKRSQKTAALQIFTVRSTPQLDEKVAQTPVKAPNKWQKLLKSLEAANLLDKKSNLSKKELVDDGNARKERNKKRRKLLDALKIARLKDEFPVLKHMPNFLSFLLARKDDGLCKRKTGFEIYCELASIHGFANFVGATTWQRVFWCCVIGLAMILSAVVVSMSLSLSSETPTMVYTQSITHPAWTIPFPAVTICNLNRISKWRVQRLARKFDVSFEELLHHSRLLTPTNFVDYSTIAKDIEELRRLLVRKNYTLAQLGEEISPDCEAELLRCKWKGRTIQCNKLFKKVSTPQGTCCTFNYYGHKGKRSLINDPQTFFDQPELTTSVGYKMGFTALLNPRASDHLGSLTKSSAYQVLIHDNADYPSATVRRHIIQARTETTISVIPRNTHATEYVRRLDVHVRRCYFPEERRLFAFGPYTQINCMAECQSEGLHEKCGCVLGFMPRKPKWPICGADLEHVKCILDYKGNLSQTVLVPSSDYLTSRCAEKFICDCYPTCEFNQYLSTVDFGILDRNFSIGEHRFFKGVTIKDHILLHVFYDDLIAEKLRLDVYENWLSYVGTFGGITGLYMGYSVISGFELIFFILIRPLCNWLTKQQIRYRIKRRRAKADKIQQQAVEAAATQLTAADTSETAQTEATPTPKVKIAGH